MKTGQELVLDLEAQLTEMKLPLMALRLDELYRSPQYPGMDKLDFLSEMMALEFSDKVSKTISNRLRDAHIAGTPCDITNCVSTEKRRYEPQNSPQVLSSLKFIEDGLNICILGASDSGKTYLAKSLGAQACEKYRVSYNRCGILLEKLADTKKEDYKKYEKQMRALLRIPLVILDDFLLHTISDEAEVKILQELLDKRLELQHSTIVCSQRDPNSWNTMILNDEVAADAIKKRATKHYTVMIQAQTTPQ